MIEEEVKIRWIYTVKMDAYINKVGVVKAMTRQQATEILTNRFGGIAVEIVTLRPIYNPITEEKLNNEYGITQNFV